MKIIKFKIGRANIAKMIQKDTGLNYKTSYDVTTAIIGIIGYNLIKNKKVVLKDFGTLRVVKPRLKKGNNINTMEVRTFQPRYKVYFRETKKIRQELLKLTT